MKQLMQAAVVCVTLSASSFTRADLTSGATVDDEGGFVATFPGRATQNTKLSPEGTNKIYNTVFDNGKATYMVSYIDFAEAYMSGHTLSEKYQLVIYGYLHKSNGMKAELLRDLSCKAGVVDGREFIVDYPDIKTVIRYRLFLLGNRFFQVGYVGPTGTDNDQTVTAFLNSFHLLH